MADDFTYVRAHKRKVKRRGSGGGGAGGKLVGGAVVGLGALAVKKYGVGNALNTLRGIINLYRKKKGKRPVGLLGSGGRSGSTALARRR